MLRCAGPTSSTRGAVFHREGQEVNPSGYYLFFFRNGELERIDNQHKMSVRPEPGDTILIPVRKGLLGVKWVVSDRKPWKSAEEED